MDNQNQKPNEMGKNGQPQQGQKPGIPMTMPQQQTNNAKPGQQNNSQSGQKPNPAPMPKKMDSSMETGSGMNLTTIAIWVVLIVLVLFVGWWFTRKPSTNSPSTSTTSTSTKTSTVNAQNEDNVTSTSLSPTNTTDTAMAAVPTSDSLAVSDQAAGTQVYVTSAKLSQVSWIAVHDSKDWVLGAARFEPGTHTNALVPLLRGTEKGQKYQVVIYVDDGDKLFDFKKDQRTTSVAPFTAQ